MSILAHQRLPEYPRHQREIDIRAIQWLTKPAVVSAMKRAEDMVFESTGLSYETMRMCFTETNDKQVKCYINLQRWMIASASAPAPRLKLRDPLHGRDILISYEGQVDIVSIKKDCGLILTHGHRKCEHTMNKQYIPIADDFETCMDKIELTCLGQIRLVIPLADHLVRRIDSAAMPYIQQSTVVDKLIDLLKQIELLIYAQISRSKACRNKSHPVGLGNKANYFQCHRGKMQPLLEEQVCGFDSIDAPPTCHNLHKDWRLIRLHQQECLGLVASYDQPPLVYVVIATAEVIVPAIRQVLNVQPVQHGPKCAHGRMSSDVLINWMNHMFDEMPIQEWLMRSQDECVFLQQVSEARVNGQRESFGINWSLT